MHKAFASDEEEHTASRDGIYYHAIVCCYALKAAQLYNTHTIPLSAFSEFDCIHSTM